MMLTAAFALSLIVNVSAPADVPPFIISEALVEADRIWHASGTAFTWRRDSTLPAALRIVLERETDAPADAATLPIGWVLFESGVPEADIHVSYANAERLLDQARSGMALSSSRVMTRIEHDTLLARAMGRALAHELGHVLLASKAHTKSGLMKATRSANEFFAPEPPHFEITAAQRTDIAARLSRLPMVTSR